MVDEHPAIFNLRQALHALRGERMRTLAGSSHNRLDAKATEVQEAAAFLTGVCHGHGIECPTVLEVAKSPGWEMSHVDNSDTLNAELAMIANALPALPKDGRRRGRLTKQESNELRMAMMGKLRQHPTLRDDVPKLAMEIGVDAKTVRAWLDDEEKIYRESRANPRRRR